MSKTKKPGYMDVDGPIPEDDEEYYKHLRQLVKVGLFKQLRGDEDAPPPAAIGQANAFLDGKGRKGEEIKEQNEYAKQTLAGTIQKFPELDMEGDDDATKE